MPRASVSIHDDIHAILNRTRIVAVIGASPNPGRPSHRILTYLRSAGYDVIPINPSVDEIDGLHAYPRLADVPGPVDLVVIFRRSADAAAHVDEAIQKSARGIWLQLGITTPDGAAKAARAGIAYVENRCVMVEHRARFQ